MNPDCFEASDFIDVQERRYRIYRLDRLEKLGLTQLSRLPISIRVMLESVLRQCNDKEVTKEDVINLARWEPTSAKRPSLPFCPAG